MKYVPGIVGVCWSIVPYGSCGSWRYGYKERKKDDGVVGFRQLLKYPTFLELPLRFFFSRTCFGGFRELHTIDVARTEHKCFYSTVNLLSRYCSMY